MDTKIHTHTFIADDITKERTEWKNLHVGTAYEVKSIILPIMEIKIIH